MTSTLPTISLGDRLRGSWRVLLKEVVAFGVVGVVGFAIDIVLFNVFFHDGQVLAKCISTVVATTVTYFGNRYFSFSHRARTNLRRETSVFFGINFITLLLSLAVIAIFAYPLGFKHDVFVMNLANLGSIAVGTVIRFWSYKRFVFLHPESAVAKTHAEARARRAEAETA